MQYRLIFFLAFISFSISHIAVAQRLKPKGVFLEDSIKLGAPVKYSLSIQHNSETQILFPDSSYNYFPFEFISKEYFPTITKNGRSLDSAVYTLRSFELDTVQSISLPIYVSAIEDSTAIKGVKDSVYLQELLPAIPVSEDFKEQASIAKISQSFNYPWTLVYSLITFCIVFIIYFFFGKTIKRRIKLFTIRLDHNNFIKGFLRLQVDFATQKELGTLERSLSTWKVYLAKLENKPINTYTTTEISNLYNHEELKNGLNIIDRAIYGGLITDEADKAIATLRRFSVRQYHRRKKEIQDV